MIQVNWKGRFGNHLFQASCANALSKKFKQQTLHEWKFILNQNKETQAAIRNESIIVNNKNIEEIFNSDVNEYNLILDDYFQNKFCIGKFIELNSYTNPLTNLEDCTFVHIRLGDIKNVVSLDYKYYQNAIKIAGADNVIISSDSADDEIVKGLIKEFNARIFNANEVDTIIKGANCRRKVLSLGTFSWWIGFLGDIFWKQESTVTISPKTNRVRKWHGNIFPMFDWQEI